MIGDHLLWVEKLIDECEIREPPLNIYQLILFYDQLEIEFRYFSEKFEGACLTFGPAIEKTIVLNSNFDCRWYRRRFTAAHEFGHALFHDGYDFNLLSKREIKRVEMEANSFAAMLLMPQNLLEKLHSAYGFLSTGMISSIFGVSKKAAKFRLYAYYKAAPNDRKRRWRPDKLYERGRKTSVQPTSRSVMGSGHFFFRLPRVSGSGPPGNARWVNTSRPRLRNQRMARSPILR